MLITFLIKKLNYKIMNINNIKNYLDDYSIYYLSKYTVTAEKFKLILKRKILKDFLKKKLNNDQKNQAEKNIGPIISKYIEKKVIDEEYSIKNKVMFLKKKGTSIRKIEIVLIQNMYAKNLIKKEIDNLKSEKDIEIKLLNIFCKKQKLIMYDKLWDKNNKKKYNKTIGKLTRAGFSYEICSKFIKEYGSI